MRGNLPLVVELECRATVLVISIPLPGVAQLALEAGDGIPGTIGRLDIDGAPRLRHDVQREAVDVLRRHARLDRCGNERIAAEDRDGRSTEEIGRGLRVDRISQTVGSLHERFDVVGQLIRGATEEHLVVGRRAEVRRVTDVVAGTAHLQVGGAKRAVVESLRHAARTERDALVRGDERAGDDGAAIGCIRLRDAAGNRLAKVGRATCSPA